MPSFPVRRSFVLVACAALVACGEAGEDEFLAPEVDEREVLGQALDPSIEALPDAELIDKTLMVLDPSVVDSVTAQSRLDNPAASGNGEWSFGYLMKSLAGTQDPSAFTEQFLSQLATPQTVNGFVTQPVMPFFAFPPAAGEALSRWCRTSDGRLDLTRAPFRLMAIVNRLDLRQSGSEAGELRFIFTLLETDDSCKASANDAGLLPAVVGSSGLNVIFEFQQRGTTCSSARAIAGSWRKLALLPFGATYNAALATITRKTVAYRTSTRPNRSQINQVRTNEPASPSDWTLREFKLGGTQPALGTTNHLLMSPPAASPDLSLSNTPELASWAAENATRILAGTVGAQPLPLMVNGRRFAGAQSKTFVDTFFVDGVVNRDLGFQTCGGCHSRRAIGAHVGQSFGTSPLGRDVGARAQLSDFMTGEFPRRVALLRALPEASACAGVEANGAVGSDRPEAVSPGAPVYVNSVVTPSGSATQGPVLRLFRVGGPDSAALQTTPLPLTAALTTTVLTAPTELGAYEVRVFNPAGTRLATSRPFFVERNVDYQVSHGTFVARGTPMTVFWSSPTPHDADDRIAWYRPGDPDAGPLSTTVTGVGIPESTSRTSGQTQVTAPATAGTYELRYVRAGTLVTTAVGTPITVF